MHNPADRILKRLVLVRHAKAVHWGYENDFIRSLTDRGRNDAERISFHLRESGIIPDAMITSPATRALQTATIFASVFNFPEGQIIQNQELYHGYTTFELLKFIQTFTDESKCVFIFGHNPSFEYYALGLCKSFRNEMPTCSAVIIDFPAGNWKNTEAHSGILFKQVNPKDMVY